MHKVLHRVPRSRRRPYAAKSYDTLVTCSICLRVLDGSDWKEADQMIRELRSYELVTPPRLVAAICDLCTESILGRRAEEVEQVAA
jgi:hypothetical protein